MAKVGTNVHTPRLPLSRRGLVLGLIGLGSVVLVGSAGIAWFAMHTTPQISTTPVTSPPIGNLLYTYQGHQDKVVAVGWSPDGKRIASGSWDHTAQAWDALTGDHVVTYRGHTKAINSLSWSPDGKAIATSSLDGTAQVWNAATTQEIVRYSGHAQNVAQYGVSAVAWSPKNPFIASAGDDKTVQIWTADTGKRVYPPLIHSAIVRCVAWSPDGRYIASGGFDDQVLVWQVATGSILTHHKHTAHVCSVAWSPDGQYLVSASDDRKVQVWKWNVPAQPPFTFDDTTVYQRVDSLGMPHPKPTSEDDFYAPGTNVFAVAWSPNGKRIASVDEGGYMFTWDAMSTGDNLSLHNGDFHFVNAVAWAPDGKHIATGNDSFQVQIWQEG